MKKIILSFALFFFFSNPLSGIAFENKTKEPTLITSDGPMDVNFSKKIALFKDNVVVIDPQGKVISDEMKVYFAKETNEIKKIECKGNVKIFQSGRYSESDEAVFFAAEKKIIITGDPGRCFR